MTRMSTPILYCCDPPNPRRVDEHFAYEAQLLEVSGNAIAVIDHDALLRGDAERAVERVPRGLGAAWYRGWMMPADRYGDLARALRDRGADLVVTPEEYRSAHELPGWYEAFSELTPVSAWVAAQPEEVPDQRALTALVEQLCPGAGIVKDYVKSRKHEWAEACFIPDLSDAAAVARIVGRFVELQGEDLTGGVVLREFESFVEIGPQCEQVRVWWLDGQAYLVTPHPDGPDELGMIPELEPVEEAVRRLGARFVTTDIALRADGVWRVVEVGDGQVSDLHKSVDPAELVFDLLAA